MIKIVLFGPESTGKTFLAEKLAAHFNTIWIPEFARGYLENKISFYDPTSGPPDEICTPADILPIALGQKTMENYMATQANHVVFCDTNLHQTQVYVQYYFNTTYPWLSIMANEQPADLYLLTNIEIPWKKDPLRDRPNHREELWKVFKNYLETNHLPFQEISETGQKRTEKAIAMVESFLNQR